MNHTRTVVALAATLAAVTLTACQPNEIVAQANPVAVAEQAEAAPDTRAADLAAVEEWQDINDEVVATMELAGRYAEANDAAGIMSLASDFRGYGSRVANLDVTNVDLQRAQTDYVRAMDYMAEGCLDIDPAKINRATDLMDEATAHVEDATRVLKA